MLRPLVIRRVVGKSMEPGLFEGQIVVASSWRRLKPDQVVIARIDDREVIKRVTNIDRDFCDLVSDHSDGSNYRKVAIQRIIATTL